MKKSKQIRILLLCNEFDSALAIRSAVARSELNLALVQVASRQEFVTQLERDRPTIALIGRCGTIKFSLVQVLEVVRERAPGVPVVVLGYGERESDDLAIAMEAIRNGASDYLHSSDLGRLPLILERADRDQETAPANDRLRFEVRQAADLLRESQKLVTIGRLAGSIAHEINNPLGSVTNLLYLLSIDENLTERARGYISTAQSELERVGQIAKQTLNFYRDTLYPVRILPAELLEEVLVLYSRRVAEKQLKVVREFDSTRAITASPGEMRQVFSNLITNAIEASEKGGILHLRVRDSRQWRGDAVRGVRISIGDTGSGISHETRRRIGEPFFTTKGHLGTGLGIWVTQSIVQRYGGAMQVSSSTQAEGHGTVFSIFLPASQRSQGVIAINDPHGNGHPTAHAGGGGSGPHSFSSGGPSAKRPRQRSENVEYGTK